MRTMLFAASALALSGPLFVAAAPTASAQVEQRVDRLEKEMRAVQRKVFPGGTPLEAEITKPAAPTVAPGTPSSAPIADLTARVSSLEQQLASITNQVEENSFKLKQMEDAFTKYKAELETRLAASQPAPMVNPSVAVPANGGSSTRPTASAKPAEAEPAAGASEERKTAVAAIERPSTKDAAMDSYSYGFRLWEAKFYPEAQSQLKATVDKYGDNAVASRAANLLGRAYLDDGKPALASVAFYENYQKRPRGDRAPDSLTYLGEALIQLKKPADACKVYQELEQVYGTSLSSSLRGMMDKGRTRAKCS